MDRLMMIELDEEEEEQRCPGMKNEVNHTVHDNVWGSW